MKRIYESYITLPDTMMIDSEEEYDEDSLKELALKSLAYSVKHGANYLGHADIEVNSIESEDDMDDNTLDWYNGLVNELTSGNTFVSKQLFEPIDEYLDRENKCGTIRKKLEDMGWELDEGFEDDLKKAIDILGTEKAFRMV